jgi:excisionase family DNA binding protein
MELENILESKNDSARLLGISLRKLEYLIAEKKLKTVPIGKRVMIRRRTLEEFARKNEQ